MPHKDNDNLKRGNIDPEKLEEWQERGLKPQPHGGAVAPPLSSEEYVGIMAEGREKAKREDDRIRERVGNNPDAALEEIHASITILAASLLKRAARERSKVPDRAVMDVVREFRQTQEAVNEARKARGAVAELDDFFATLDARLPEVEAMLAAGLKPFGNSSA